MYISKNDFLKKKIILKHHNIVLINMINMITNLNNYIT